MDEQREVLKAWEAGEQQEHEHRKSLVEHVINLPAAPELLLTILEVVPLQLLAYPLRCGGDAMCISRGI